MQKAKENILLAKILIENKSIISLNNSNLDEKIERAEDEK